VAADPQQADDAWITDERLAEILKQEKVEPGRLHPEQLAALMEIRQRRSWGRTSAAPARKTEFTKEVLVWARASLEFDIQNLYDDPYGVGGESKELGVLEEYELLETVAAELGVDLAATAGRCALEYERGRMEKILAAGRWARGQADQPTAEPEELEAL